MREVASEALSGFFHCEFIKIDNDLVKSFKAKAATKLKKIKKTETNCSLIGNVDPNDLVMKHSGVLGLCACVNASPYDVPSYVPDILMTLGEYLNTPEPIHVSINSG